MMSENSSRCPFTASQWQELEHQALIFKYMASGAPVPQDLIGPIRRSLCLEPASTSPMLLFHHQPNSFGWGCFQMGFGTKVEDPEPWRCRRTDGKKWRCSKEAFPDSKYCERHMHRGKNRSRKPVEISIAATSTYAAAPTSPSLLPGHHLSMVTATEAQHLLNPYAVSSRRHDFFRDPSSSSDANRHGMKSPVDQRDACWRFTPLGLSPIGERRQRSCSFLQQNDGAAAQEEKRRHCFVLGTDIRAERGSEAPQPVSFLSEEWSRKARNEQAGWGAFPMTQLSISMAHYDFQVDSSRSAAGN